MGNTPPPVNHVEHCRQVDDATATGVQTVGLPPPITAIVISYTVPRELEIREIIASAANVWAAEPYVLCLWRLKNICRIVMRTGRVPACSLACEIGISDDKLTATSAALRDASFKEIQTMFLAYCAPRTLHDTYDEVRRECRVVLTGSAWRPFAYAHELCCYPTCPVGQ